MPSPFPGMNPFLEQPDVWYDFHQRFISHAADMLETAVGPNYIVKIEAQLFLRELSGEERRLFGRGDVGVSRLGDAAASAQGSSVAVAPLQLVLPAFDEEELSRLEIIDRRKRRVVTVIELLSPANKTPGPDRDAYLAKRRILMNQSSNFVEIDLRRGGERPAPPEIPSCDYYALVCRYEARPTVGVWPLDLRERLPNVPVPLSAPDPDVQLDIQQALDHVYDAAGYAKYIYSDLPEPPLSDEDAEWAHQFIAPPGGS